MPRRSKMLVSSLGRNSSDSSVRGDRLTLRYVSAIERAGAVGDDLQAGHVELHRPIGALGGREQRAGVRERRALGQPDEALVADRPARREREDRLVDRTQQPSGEDRADRRAQVLDRAIVGRQAVAARVVRGGVGPAVALAPVQGRVGVAVQQAALDARRREGGHADRQRERLGRPRRIAAAQPAGEDPAGDGQAGVDVRARQDDRELVAPDPERAVIAPKRGGHGPADRLQELVAAGVASLVVDALEVVDVDQQERQRRATPDGHVELAGELFLERSMVSEAGQAVEQRILARLPVQLTQSRVLPRQPPDVAQDGPSQTGEDERDDDHGGQQEDDGAGLSRSGARPETLDGRDPHQDREGSAQHDQDPAPDRLRVGNGQGARVAVNRIGQGPAW